jgi:cephalosporin hydroxylase
MKITIDFSREVVESDTDEGVASVPIYSAEGFDAVTRAWLKIGWVVKHIYGFTWMGRPIIQLPDDLVRMQEVIYRIKPDVIIETGVAHGGSLIFYASLCKAMEHGRVIGVDIDIRAHNRDALDAHPLRPYIELVEGSSIAPEVVARVRDLVKPGETALVSLDSDHSKKHVLAELEAYSPFVTPGSYIVATDGIMEILHDAPRGKPEWKDDNPAAAADAFLRGHPEFVGEEPPFPFNEGSVQKRVTHWPRAFLKRLPASSAKNAAMQRGADE